jgi:murein DD-endopeptidase MepM/ murein hydrolase activator NlpD
MTYNVTGRVTPEDLKEMQRPPLGWYAQMGALTIAFILILTAPHKVSLVAIRMIQTYNAVPGVPKLSVPDALAASALADAELADQELDTGAAPTSIDQMFEGGADSLVAIAVGNAEGTRTPDGGKTSAYGSHADPGNGVTNMGTFSYQHGAASPEAADQKQLTRLRGQLDSIAPELPNDPKVWLNAADLLNQSPAAGADFAKYLKQCKGDILCARVESYQGDAPGITKNGITIEQDQQRRMDAIDKVLALKKPTTSGKSSGGGGWINPVPGAIFTSGFGWRDHQDPKFRMCHYGIDMAGPVGMPILAAKSGTVISSGDVGDGLGNKVILKHADGTKSLYGHNSENLVKVGDTVDQGDAIARMGSTGNSSGPHSHFEITDTSGLVIDPITAIPGISGDQTFGTIDPEKSAQCQDKKI